MAIKLELSTLDRISIYLFLKSQKAPQGHGASVTYLRPFHRIVRKIKLTDSEKTAVRFQEYSVPSAQGMLTRANWDPTELAKLPATTDFLVDATDAKACVELLKGPLPDTTAGDMDWIDPFLEQLEAKEIEVVEKQATA